MVCKIGELLSTEKCEGDLVLGSELDRYRLGYIQKYTGKDDFQSFDSICQRHLKILGKHVEKQYCVDPLGKHKGKVAGEFFNIANYKDLPKAFGAPAYRLGVSFCKNCIRNVPEVEESTHVEEAMDDSGDTFDDEGVFHKGNLNMMNGIRQTLGLPEIVFFRHNRRQREKMVRISADEIRDAVLSIHGLPKPEVDSSGLDVIVESVKPKIGESSGKEVVQGLSVVASGFSVSDMSRTFGVSRRTAENAKKLNEEPGILTEPPKKRGRPLDDNIVQKVVEFYLDDEYSKVSPKMKSVVKVVHADGSTTNESKRFLLYTISELHAKFLEKYPDLKIGRTSFSCLRPSHCQVLSIKHHEVCCCIYCENLELLFQAIKVKNIDFFLNLLVCPSKTKSCMYRRCMKCIEYSEAFVSKVNSHIQENIPNASEDGITFKQWAHVDRDIIVSQHLSAPEFCQYLAKVCSDTLKHYYINHQQFAYFRDLKQNLGMGEAIIQCDFAENYSTFYDKEIQKVFFDKEQVTIHPFVIHINTSGTVQTLSAAVVSDEMAHNTNTYFAFLKVLLGWLKETYPSLKHVHYFTDGAASQYKNFKHFTNIFHHVSDFFGLTASHNFFASCHGKSACDGIGAVLKLKVRRAAVAGMTIQTPLEFFRYVSENVKNVQCFFVSAEAVANTVGQTGLEERYLASKKIPHIRQVHRVTPSDDGHSLHIFELSNDTTPCGIIRLYDEVESCNISEIEIGDWVAAIYEFDNNWYYGQIVGVDLHEEDFAVKFFKDPGTFSSFSTLERSSTFVSFRHIIQRVPSPTKKNRKYSFPDTVKVSVVEKYNRMGQ